MTAIGCFPPRNNYVDHEIQLMYTTYPTEGTVNAVTNASKKKTYEEQLS